MLFKKGLRNSSLIQKLTMKNLRTSEQMFSIANRSMSESGHPDQPTSSKGHDKKRKPDRSVNVVERPRRHKEYRLRPGEFEGFLDHFYIFHPRESTRPEIVIDSKVFHMGFSRWPSQPIKRRSPRIPRAISPRLTMRSTIFLVVPTLMSPRGSKNS
jgi:hypothetical protein